MGVMHLLARDAGSTINDIKGAGDTFTSWDKCMAKTYCKWPVIVAIVVGSLIVLSVVFCLARCLCCGLECCCGCFSCFNHCCPSPRRQKRSKYADGPGYQPNPYHGYQPAPYAPPAPPVYEAPRFAQFETGSKNKIHEDALPAMPSWDNAATRKVEDTTESDNMEMNNLNRPGQALAPMAAAAGGPGGRGRYSPLTNPANPRGEQPGPYGGTSPTHPYQGDRSVQQAGAGNNYSRPSPPPTQSFGSTNPSAYGAQRTSPTSPRPPPGGYRNPADEDQFHPSGIAPTPAQYNAGYTSQTSAHPAYANSSWSGDSSTRYEPSTRYGQETGLAQPSSTSPKDSRPPSILQAGRKPVAGSWRDV